MPQLHPTKSLLNPKFEGYKLDPVDENSIVFRYPLAQRPTQATISGRALLSFEQVQDRIRHNHLAVGLDGRALYVDAELGVIVVALDPVSLLPPFLFTLWVSEDCVLTFCESRNHWNRNVAVCTRCPRRL